MLRYSWIALLLLLAFPFRAAAIVIQFDYTYAPAAFSTPTVQNTLNAAAAYFTGFTDQLSAIAPSGGNTWHENFTDPTSGNPVIVSNPTVPANTVWIYVGASSSLAASTLVTLTGGGYVVDSGPQSWSDTVSARGQAGALASPPTDYGRWGAAMQFSTATGVNWNFSSTSGPSSGQYDLLTAAERGIAEVLGFGRAPSWTTWRENSTTTFYGPNSIVANNGVDPSLGGTASQYFWAAGTKSTVNGVSQAAVMDPTLSTGVRQAMTLLDYAGLEDVGWQIPVPEPGKMILLAGIAFVLLQRRRSTLAAS